ncbi:MAG: peptidoglycan-binding protein [Oscillospiraceae bacterium]|nr:peptidoglycan-binding protein [Oscillospiraceae bacterium]
MCVFGARFCLRRSKPKRWVDNNPSYDPQGRDGIFGANTASAVRYFQGRRGIQVDGCVGDQTWTAFTQHWVFG